MARYELQQPRLWADFNGYFGELLCLSHGPTCRAEDGSEVVLKEGMIVTAYDDNIEDGVRDNLLATGVVEASPDWLSCRGSVWCLRIDENGLRSESDLAD